MGPGQQSSRRLGDELREQRARLLARAALLKTDVGALLAPAVDAVPPAARARLRDLHCIIASRTLCRAACQSYVGAAFVMSSMVFVAAARAATSTSTAAEARMVCTQIFALVKFFSVSSQFYDGESLVEWTARLVNDF